MSPEKRPSKPLDIYVRVSRVGGREGESFISPEVQAERAEGLLKAKGYNVGKVFTDLDQSGGKMGRPGLDEVMVRIRSGASGGVVVAKIDRFARNTRGLLEAVEEIEAAGAVWLCVEPTIDTGDEVFGKFTLTLFAAIAEMELGKIARSWMTAHERHIARGVMTGRAPAGYRKNGDGRLEIVPETAEAVVEAFRMRANGASWGSVRDYLNENGVPTSGGKLWGERTASRLLGNRTLLGEVRFGSMVKSDAHDPLPGLSEALFRKVQKTREEPVPRKRKEAALLAGILRCAVCGGRMTLDQTLRNGKPYPFYRCRSEHHQDRPSIGAAAVEAFVIEAALERAGTVWYERSLSPDGSAYEEAREGLAAVQAEAAELEEAFAGGDVSVVVYAKAASALEGRMAEAQEQVDRAAEATGTVWSYIPAPGDRDDVEGATENTAVVFARMPVEKQRQGLALLVKEARVAKLADRKVAVPVEERVELVWEDYVAVTPPARLKAAA